MNTNKQTFEWTQFVDFVSMFSGRFFFWSILQFLFIFHISCSHLESIFDKILQPFWQRFSSTWPSRQGRDSTLQSVRSRTGHCQVVDLLFFAVYHVQYFTFQVQDRNRRSLKFLCFSMSDFSRDQMSGDQKFQNVSVADILFQALGSSARWQDRALQHSIVVFTSFKAVSNNAATFQSSCQRVCDF